MTDRKWNNQGGSNRDGFNFRKPKPDKKGNIPPIQDLRESQITSFRIVKPRQVRPNYGEFGDDVWIYNFYDDDLTIKEPEIDIPEIKEPTIREPYINDFNPEVAGGDIFPYAIEDEYELVVKYGSLKIYLLSGQAFAARNDINDPRFDLSIVIDSSQPISINGRQPVSIDTISLPNSAQNPIYSLYDWLLSKLSIVTDYSAENPDPILSALRLNGQFRRLPDTSFLFNGDLHSLFYSEGIQPDQICLSAVNRVLKYDRTRDPDEGNWSVTYAAALMPLCLDLNPSTDKPIVLIQFTVGSLEQIESGSGGQFATIRVAILDRLATPLNVFVRASGTADPAFININEVLTGTVSAVSGNTLKFTILPNTLYTEAEISADIDPDQIGDKTVITSLLPNSEYEIDNSNESITTLIKLPKPLVSITFNSGSPTRVKAGNGAFFAYVARDYIRNVGLDVDLAFTGDAAFDEYQVDNFAFSNQYQVTIPSGQAGVVVKIEPNTTNLYTVDRSIVVTVIPFQSDTSKYAIDPILKNITPIIALTLNPVIIKLRPLVVSGDIRSAPLDVFLTSFFSSNSSLSGVTLNPFNLNNLETVLNAVSLSSLNGWSNLLFSDPDPIALLMRGTPVLNNSINFIQILEDKIKSFCQSNSVPDKYLLLFNGVSPSGFVNSPLSFGNISIQRHPQLQNEPDGLVLYDPTESNQPYMVGNDSNQGYIDSRWLARVVEPSNGSTPSYESFAWCIQVELNNPTNTTFLPITFSPTTGHPTKTLSAQRSQIIFP